MKWTISLGAVAFIVFLAAMGSSAEKARSLCENEGGVFVSRDYLCLKKECVINVSH
jgi:hypothetical protein